MPERFRQEFHEAMQAAKNADLETAMLREMIRSTPGLFWAKWRLENGLYRMIAVSRDYAALYLGNPNTLLYEGKPDEVIWGAEHAERFRVNDDAALEAGARLRIKEPLHSPITGVEGIFDGWKWPARVGQHSIVCGMGEHRE